MGAQDFVQRLFALISRPFQPEKCLGPGFSIQHLGLINDWTRWASRATIRLAPRPGKVEELLAQLITLRESTSSSVDDVASLTGGLMFLTSWCYEKGARGGYQALYHWIH